MDCDRCKYYEQAYDVPCHVCTLSKCPYETKILTNYEFIKNLSVQQMASFFTRYDIVTGLYVDIQGNNYGILGDAIKANTKYLNSRYIEGALIE